MEWGQSKESTLRDTTHLQKEIKNAEQLSESARPESSTIKQIGETIG